MRIRIRGPPGTSTIKLADSATVGELFHEISGKMEVASFDIKAGFPPQPLDFSAFGLTTQLQDTGIRLDGEQLIIVPKEKSSAPSTSTPAQPAKTTTSTATTEPAAPMSLTRKPNRANTDPPELPLPSHGATVVLRVMPDDNSCLFRAFGAAVLGNSLDSMTELRSMVAQGIQGNTELYNAAVLQREPDDYCRWIQHPDSWGGAIELGILSEHFDVEVCSINVQDLRVDRFNEDTEGSTGRRRVVLVYSGIHYDVVALSASEPPHTKSDLPAELDKLLFDHWDEEVLQVAVELCRVLQGQHYFTDTGAFDIKCGVCGWRGKGEKDATAHAVDTGHMDFSEAA